MTSGRRFILPALVLLLAGVAAAFPLLWLACATFKTGDDLFTGALLPWDHLDRLTLANYAQLFREQPFGRWMVNTLFLAAAQTVAAVVVASLGGFAIAKYRFVGRRVLSIVLLCTLLLPYQVLLPASYELMRRLGWLDTYWAVLAPGATSVFGLFLFARAMRQVPDDLLAAARIDGCSELRLWWDVALPLVRPMTAAFALLTFTAAWNGFLWPGVVLQDAGKYTLPLGLASLSALPGVQADDGVLMAGTLLSILPVAILFFALQNDFIAGLTSGALRE